MAPDERPLLPDAERPEPRVRDDLDPDQGPPVDDGPEGDGDGETGGPVDDSPAAGVVDPERTDPPEPSEPG